MLAISRLSRAFLLASLPGTHRVPAFGCSSRLRVPPHQSRQQLAVHTHCLSALAQPETEEADVSAEPGHSKKGFEEAEREQSAANEDDQLASAPDQRKAKAALIVDDSGHPLRYTDFPRSVWTCLLRLRAEGHEGWVVGGAVRDLLLNNRPKDFDIVTTATPAQVKRLFRQCRIVGKRFPIAHVTVGSDLLEVSSFNTRADRSLIPPDVAALLDTKDRSVAAAAIRNDRTRLWANAMQENAASRDFTVNALFYDPFSRLLLDYVGGMRDCKQRRLRTVIDPRESFEEDPCRLLRAIRHAARGGLKIDPPTRKAMREGAPLLYSVNQSRLMQEMAELLTRGSAAASLRLLWQAHLLDVLLPSLAQRFKASKLPREPGRLGATAEMLFAVLEELDQWVSPQRPVSSSVLAACLAAPFVADAAAAMQEKHLAGGGGGSDRVSYSEAVRQGMQSLLECPAERESCTVIISKEAAHRGMLMLLREMQTRPRRSEGGFLQHQPKQEAQFVSTALRSERHNWLGLTNSDFWADYVTAADSQVL